MDARKLVQIGFAALLARKQSTHKQYIYEDRTEGGFSFEPVLRNNEATMADEEYMKKKYYSQVVYESTMDGSIQTSIREANPNRRAARRLWAGRAGTGWNGTGRGGYMDSLQPGVPETQGTGLGSPKKESDLLMQVYLEKQAEKMHVLKGKSQQATQDLFRRIAEHSDKTTGVADLSSKGYIPSYKDAGVSFSDLQNYIRPYLDGSPPPKNAPRSQQKAWVEKAIRKFEAKGGVGGTQHGARNSSFFSPLGQAQHQYAEHLAQTKPGFFNVSERRRLLASSLQRETLSSWNKDGLYEDFDTIDGFMDYEAADEYYGRPEGPRSGRDQGVTQKPNNQNFTGDGGALIGADNTEIASQTSLRNMFRKRTVSELYPQAWQKFQAEKRINANKLEREEGRLLNQSSSVPTSVQVSSVQEATEFIRWMQKTLNAEQKRLNEVTLESSYFFGPSKSPTRVTGMDDFKGTYGQPGGYTDTMRYITRGGLGNYKQEIAKGMTADYKLLNGEYLMFNKFGLLKDPKAGTERWLFKNEERERRGVDMYFPQQGGLLRVHISARIVPEVSYKAQGTSPARAYVAIDIPKNGIKFIPDVELSLAEVEVQAQKADEGAIAFKNVTEEFWRNGLKATYMGAAMTTQAGESSRMFLGDRSPVNSVGFFTSTVTQDDFASQLKSLVDISAKEWWSDNTGFNSFFDLHEMEGGAFKEWALKWEEESRSLQNSINQRIEQKWKQWVSEYAGGGVTAAPPSIAKSWAAPVKLGPFVHSTKYLGQAQSVGRRKHGYYIQGNMYGG